MTEGDLVSTSTLGTSSTVVRQDVINDGAGPFSSAEGASSIIESAGASFRMSDSYGPYMFKNMHAATKNPRVKKTFDYFKLVHLQVKRAIETYISFMHIAPPPTILSIQRRGEIRQEVSLGTFR